MEGEGEKNMYETDNSLPVKLSQPGSSGEN